jgi:hypothetical protein
MLYRCIVSAMMVVALPWSMLAQEQARTITQLILGVGLTGSESGWSQPTYTAGFDVKRSTSNLSLRVVTEYTASDRTTDSFWSSSRTVGVQLLGVRTFGAHRIQPYVVAGSGLYQTSTEGVGSQFYQDTSGALFSRPVPYKRIETRPTLIWGTGANIRMGSGALFFELKLPLYYNNAFHVGPQSPLLVGVRF